MSLTWPTQKPGPPHGQIGKITGSIRCHLTTNAGIPGDGTTVHEIIVYATGAFIILHTITHPDKTEPASKIHRKTDYAHNIFHATNFDHFHAYLDWLSHPDNPLEKETRRIVQSYRDWAQHNNTNHPYTPSTETLETLAVTLALHNLGN